MGCIELILGLYRGYLERMEKKMETTMKNKDHLTLCGPHLGIRIQTSMLLTDSIRAEPVLGAALRFSVYRLGPGFRFGVTAAEPLKPACNSKTEPQRLQSAESNAIST